MNIESLWEKSLFRTSDSHEQMKRDEFKALSTNEQLNKISELLYGKQRLIKLINKESL